MSQHTKISWCDSTVNPTMGCGGCELHQAGHDWSTCYAARLTRIYAGHPGWPASFDQPQTFPGRIEQACRWKDLTGTIRPYKPWLNGYPRLIFVGDMGDVFTESLPWNFLADYMPMMAAAPHIWIICTKRPARAEMLVKRYGCPKNFWFLTTVTSYNATARRILEIQRLASASVVGVSMEPLLSAFSLAPFLACNRLGCSGAGGDHKGLDWVIVGGESGPGARPMDPAWAREIRDQCVDAGVPFFFKQLGECRVCKALERDGHKSACDMLDGVRWHQMPRWPRP